MRKKRVMLIGPRGSGKTLLAQYLDQKTQCAVNICKNTPNMMYGTETIDVPGAYLECPWMHKHLIAAAQDAYCVLMMLSGTQEREYYPPGFAGVFRVPVIGILSEYGKGCSQNSIGQLNRAGVKGPYYHISLSDQRGFAELKEAVLQRKGGE